MARTRSGLGAKKAKAPRRAASAARGEGAGPSPAAAPVRLWAPWRMEFIQSAKSAGCIFCELPAQEGEENDRKNLIVHRSPTAFSILNRYPYNSGHVMVVPRVHVALLEDLSPEDFVGLHQELQLAARTLRKVYRPEGLNVGMNLGRIAGAGIVDHLHYHVVPRWAGDNNFMPVLADTRVMVEHLDATWRKIRAGFDQP